MSSKDSLLDDVITSRLPRTVRPLQACIYSRLWYCVSRFSIMLKAWQHPESLCLNPCVSPCRLDTLPAQKLPESRTVHDQTHLRRQTGDTDRQFDRLVYELHE